MNHLFKRPTALLALEKTSETDLPEIKMFVSSANNFMVNSSLQFLISFTYIRNSSGPRTDP
jgi:hypothetical protein